LVAIKVTEHKKEEKAATRKVSCFFLIFVLQVGQRATSHVKVSGENLAQRSLSKRCTKYW
jgi:hypothetical protein